MMKDFNCLNCGHGYIVDDEDFLCLKCGRKRERVVKLGKIIDPGEDY